MRKSALMATVAMVLPLFAFVRGPNVRVNRLAIGGAHYFTGVGSWEVRSPTIKCPSGYLAYDASGKSEKVTFRKEKEPGIRWSFVEVPFFTRTRALGEAPHNKGTRYEEKSGYTMRIRAAEGPFEGWYLGRRKNTGEWPPELLMVKGRGEAMTLEMLLKTVEYARHSK